MSFSMTKKRRDSLTAPAVMLFTFRLRRSKSTAFRELSNYYPKNSGLKIVSHPGGISEGVYVSKGEGESRLHLKLIHNLRHLTLVANLLYVMALGRGCTIWLSCSATTICGLRLSSSTSRSQ